MMTVVGYHDCALGMDFQCQCYGVERTPAHYSRVLLVGPTLVVSNDHNAPSI